MKSEEYIAEVMVDGRLSLPKKLIKILELEPHAKVRVVIEKISSKGKRPQKLNEEIKKALTIKEFITDLGPEDLSEKFREKYK
ncbi:MAG: hypothetical protein V1872_06060 [bacterium]